MTDAPNLKGHVVAYSMSPPNDLARLGFPPVEFDRVVFNLCMRVIRTKGRILYGGHLQDNSLTARMFEFAASAYVPGGLRDRADAPKPFLHLLPMSEFTGTPFSRLYDIQNRFGSFLETRIITDEHNHLTLSKRGDKLMFRDSAVKDDFLVGSLDELRTFSSRWPRIETPEALTAMRNAAHQLTNARIVLGGKRGDLGVSGERDRFHGAMPGIYEETLSSIDAPTPIPIIVLGGYGGAARDVAIDLGLINQQQAVPHLGDIQPQYAEAREEMRRAKRKIPEPDYAMMAHFAPRDDCEDLARDVVAAIAFRLERGIALQAG